MVIMLNLLLLNESIVTYLIRHVGKQFLCIFSVNHTQHNTASSVVEVFKLLLLNN